MQPLSTSSRRAIAGRLLYLILGIGPLCLACLLSAPSPAQEQAAEQPASEQPKVTYNQQELHQPVRLEADGQPIDIGTLSNIAHAGPWVADVDEDGDRDLLVGDFPGYFWFFENTGDDSHPQYTSQGKLEAGGEPAKTPVY